jgi:AcrR family transcriptional regulator
MVMARTRTAAYDDQRELILAQAAALFARQGYTATSMNQVAAACGISKPTLYHYVQDKHELLLLVAQAHIDRLQALVAEVEAGALPPRQRLQTLIERFVLAYADAQHEHRVLTEDVKFLDEAARERVLAGASLATPLTMLLFGMINWMFTWLKPGGALSHAAMAPVVVDLFLGGLGAVQVPRSVSMTSKKETVA